MISKIMRWISDLLIHTYYMWMAAETSVLFSSKAIHCSVAFFEGDAFSLLIGMGIVLQDTER